MTDVLITIASVPAGHRIVVVFPSVLTAGAAAPRGGGGGGGGGGGVGVEFSPPLTCSISTGSRMVTNRLAGRKESFR